MKVTHRLEQNVVVVSLEESVILEEVGELKAYLAPLVADDTMQGLILNFEQVEHVDSSGVGLIISTYKSLQQRQGQLALCEMNPALLRIFSMTKLDKVIKTFETEADAIRSFFS